MRWRWALFAPLSLASVKRTEEAVSTLPLHIVNVVGARPNFMKIAPLMKEYAKHPAEIKTTLVHTGQHYDESMSETFFSTLEMQKPDINLGVGSGSHAEQTARVMMGFEKALLQLQPNLVVVVGDVNSTMACTIVAAKMNIAVAHVEAGLRSYDRTMPEEINRIVTDSLATLLFTTTADASGILNNEGIPRERIFFVGNTMIDSLLWLQQRLDPEVTKAKFGINGAPYALVTLHRPSNVDDGPTLSGICQALDEIQRRIPLVWPLHPRTQRMLATHKMMPVLNAMKNLVVVPALNYLDSISLMATATLVLTDSGGVQEETTVLGIPCLTLRMNTERPITITEGTNELVGNAPADIVRSALHILRTGGKKGRRPQLWDGRTAERIVRIILEQSSSRGSVQSISPLPAFSNFSPSIVQH